MHPLILSGVTKGSQHSCLLSFCLVPPRAPIADWTNHSLQRTPFSKRRDVKQYAGVTSDAHYASGPFRWDEMLPRDTEASWIESIKDVVISFYVSVNAVEESVL